MTKPMKTKPVAQWLCELCHVAPSTKRLKKARPCARCGLVTAPHRLRLVEATP